MVQMYVADHQSHVLRVSFAGASTLQINHSSGYVVRLISSNATRGECSTSNGWVNVDVTSHMALTFGSEGVFRDICHVSNVIAARKNNVKDVNYFAYKYLLICGVFQETRQKLPLLGSLQAITRSVARATFCVSTRTSPQRPSLWSCSFGFHLVNIRHLTSQVHFHRNYNYRFIISFVPLFEYIL